MRGRRLTAEKEVKMRSEQKKKGRGREHDWIGGMKEFIVAIRTTCDIKGARTR